MIDFEQITANYVYTSEMGESIQFHLNLKKLDLKYVQTVPIFKNFSIPPSRFSQFKPTNNLEKLFNNDINILVVL